MFPSTYPTKAIPPVKRYKINKNLMLKTILTLKTIPTDKQSQPSISQSVADFLARGGKITICKSQDETKSRLLAKYQYKR